MDISVTSGKVERQRSGCAVLGIHEGRRLGAPAKRLDQASDGLLSKLVRASALRGRTGQTLLVHHLPGVACEQVLLVGLGPRVLARLLRMRRLLETIDARGPVGWSERAAELGWLDQAHLIRDFKRHTGVTPTTYLAARRSVYDAHDLTSATAFVPEV